MAKRRIPKLYRRLRVVRDDEDKTTSRALRDVFLESAVSPIVKDLDTGELREADYRTELCAIALECEIVADLICWAEEKGVHIVYEPPGNMSKWFGRKAPGDIRLLFDIG